MNDKHTQPKSHRGVFIVVFLMLCALTGLSFWIANSHLMEDQMTGWLAMMCVSLAKAFLVVTFFMHLWWEKKWKYVLTIPAILMSVLLVMLLVPDIADRVTTYSKTRASYAPAAESEMTASPDAQESHE